MKKVFLCSYFIIQSIICFGQDDEIDIKNLHSIEGKQWKRSINPDGKQFPASMEDDIFVFFSDGTFRYDQNGTESKELANIKVDKWIYDSENHILSWNLILPNGTIRKVSCEIMRLSSDKITMNLSEGASESYLIVFRTF
jgi:hypothetical protein